MLVYSLGTLQLAYAVQGHIGHVMRISWHPTNENVLTTGSELRGNINESLVRAWDLSEIEAGAEVLVDRVVILLSPSLHITRCCLSSRLFHTPYKMRSSSKHRPPPSQLLREADSIS